MRPAPPELATTQGTAARLRRLMVDTAPLREHRDFRLILIGQTVNQLGSQMTVVALPYQAYVLTRSPLALSGLAAMQLLATVSLSLLGGAIADSVDRRRLLLTTQVGLALVSAAMAALAILQLTTIWELYGLAFAASSLSAIERPARQAILPRLVSRHRLSGAMALNQVVLKTATVLGPVLAGALIGWVGVGAAFAADALSFLAGIAALLGIGSLPPLQRQPGLTIEAIRAGLSYVRRAPVVLSIFAVDLDANIFGLPAALFPILALDVFHTGSGGLGLLVAAPAVGAILGVLFSGWLHRLRWQGRVVFGAVLAWGVAMTLFGLAPWFPLALAFLVLAGAADMVSTVLRGTIVQLTTPDHLRGRVSALNGMVTFSGPRLGDIEATAVAALAGTQFSVVTGGLLCIVGLAAVARWLPNLLHYDAWSAPHSERPLREAIDPHPPSPPLPETGSGG